MIASDHWGVDIPNAVANNTASAWIGTTFLVNEILTPTTPYDGALWSLAYEWTYYVLAAAAVFVAALDRRPAAFLLYIYAAALLTLCALMAPVVLAMGLFWIAGAAASQVERFKLPYLTVPLFVMTLLATRFDLFGGFLEDALMATATALLIADRSILQRTAFAKSGVYLASFSYSLYAIHWPIMLGVLAVAQARGFLPERLPPGVPAYALIGTLIALAYGAARLFASLTEQRMDGLRKLLSNAGSPAQSQTPDGTTAATPRLP